MSFRPLYLKIDHKGNLTWNSSYIKNFEGLLNKIYQSFLFPSSKHKVLLTIPYSPKKARQMKRYSDSIIVLATSFGRNLSTSDMRFVQVISVKKGTKGNISQPRPDHLLVSIYVLSLKHVAWATNWFPLGSLISTIITWINLKLDIDNFFLRCRKHNHQTKIPD